MFKKDNLSSRRYKPAKILFFILVFIAFFSAISFVVMLLWNAILPDVANVKPLKFWQAAGLLLLAKILFGGFRGRRRNWKRSEKNNWKKKWMAMNEEERQEAKLRWQKYCKQKDSKE